jgi:glycosyltransferase involved in cell wall biosynthesis
VEAITAFSALLSEPEKRARATGLTKPPVLYISYDGMLEPLGQSQVLGYLEKLARGWPVHLMSFEKTKDRSDWARMDAMRVRLKTAGIAWTPLAYHKTPSAPATAYDIAAGTAVALAIAARHRVGIIHARSYVPALMALTVQRLTGAKFLFDMRGFWADERVDGGLWAKDGRMYRVAKRLERTFLEAADHVVTLTHASADEIARFPYLQQCLPPITVIPTCADLDRFKPGQEAGDGIFRLGYVGSVGLGQLFEHVLQFFSSVKNRKPDAQLLVLNRGEHDVIKAAVAKVGLDPACVEVRAADHGDIQHHIARMRAAAAIYKPGYSALARAPTKLAEYLGCGIPCVGNINVGDMEQILEGERVGVALRDFSSAEIEAGVDRLLALLDEPGTGARCIDTAHRLFSLNGGVEAYDAIYGSLTGTCSADDAMSVNEARRAKGGPL